MPRASRISQAKTSWRGQPSPTSAIRAPEARTRSASSTRSSAVECAELRRFGPGDLEAGEAFAEAFDERGEHRLAAAVEVDGQALCGGPLEDAQRQVRPVDAVGEAGAVQPVQRPAHRLAVRGDEVEVVEPVAVLGVLDAGHDAVDGESGDSVGTALVGGADDPLDGGVVVDGVDQDAEDVALAEVDHTRPPLGVRVVHLREDVLDVVLDSPARVVAPRSEPLSPIHQM